MVDFNYSFFNIFCLFNLHETIILKGLFLTRWRAEMAISLNFGPLDIFEHDQHIIIPQCVLLKPEGDNKFFHFYSSLEKAESEKGLVSWLGRMCASIYFYDIWSH